MGTELFLYPEYAKEKSAVIVTDNTDLDFNRYKIAFAKCYAHQVSLLPKSELGKFIKKNQPDLIFGNENEVQRIADQNKIPFIPVDEQDRISSFTANKKYSEKTEAKRVVLFGCESTGKSVMAEKLAEHFGGYFTEEYARTYLLFFGDKGTIDDIPITARGQFGTEKALLNTESFPPFLFCDSDLLLTKIWSNTLFGDCPSQVSELAEKQKSDLTLLLDIDLPWKYDDQRCLPNKKEREKFQDKCMEELENLNRKYVLISGDGEVRFQNAIHAVEKHFEI